MCTLIALRRGDPYRDLVVALNRDEFHSRPTAPPEQRGPAIYGVDLLRGGSWFVARTSGLLVGLTNRRGEGSPAAVRSRGELVVVALEQGSVLAYALGLTGWTRAPTLASTCCSGTAASSISRSVAMGAGGFGAV